MYYIKPGEVSITIDDNNIKIYYCPGNLSGNDKIVAVKNIESEYGTNRNYQIIEVPEGRQVSSKPFNLDEFLPKPTISSNFSKEPEEEGKVPNYTIEYDKDEEIYNVFINVEEKLKKDSEKIIYQELFKKIPKNSRYRLIWHYTNKNYDIIDDPQKADELISLLSKGVNEVVENQSEVNKFGEEINRYNELADLEALWETPFTGKNTKK